MEDELKELVRRIEELRRELVRLVEQHGSLLASDVLAASRRLDAVLAEYHELLRRKQAE